MAQPEKIFKCQNVQVSVFSSRRNGPRTGQATVAYKDSDGDWQYTTSLSAKDMLVAAHLLRQAADYIMEQESNEVRVRRRSDRAQANRGTRGAADQDDHDAADVATGEEDSPF